MGRVRPHRQTNAHHQAPRSVERSRRPILQRHTYDAPPWALPQSPVRPGHVEWAWPLGLLANAILSDPRLRDEACRWWSLAVEFGPGPACHAEVKGAMAERAEVAVPRWARRASSIRLAVPVLRSTLEMCTLTVVSLMKSPRAIRRSFASYDEGQHFPLAWGKPGDGRSVRALLRGVSRHVADVVGGGAAAR